MSTHTHTERERENGYRKHAHWKRRKWRKGVEAEQTQTSNRAKDSSCSHREYGEVSFQARKVSDRRAQVFWDTGAEGFPNRVLAYTDMTWAK